MKLIVKFMPYIKAVVFWLMPCGCETMKPQRLAIFWRNLLLSSFALSKEGTALLRILVTEFRGIVIHTTTVLIFTDEEYLFLECSITL
jgi:hypothetical protein